MHDKLNKIIIHTQGFPKYEYEIGIQKFEVNRRPLNLDHFAQRWEKGSQAHIGKLIFQNRRKKYYIILN